jgi:hypothetical protein
MIHDTLPHPDFIDPNASSLIKTGGQSQNASPPFPVSTLKIRLLASITILRLGSESQIFSPRRRETMPSVCISIKLFLLLEEERFGDGRRKTPKLHCGGQEIGIFPSGTALYLFLYPKTSPGNPFRIGLQV